MARATTSKKNSSSASSGKLVCKYESAHDSGQLTPVTIEFPDDADDVEEDEGDLRARCSSAKLSDKFHNATSKSCLMRSSSFAYLRHSCEECIVDFLIFAKRL